MAVLGFGNGFRDARQWYIGIAQLARQTCLIEMPDSSVGTGFLVGPDLLLTTGHNLKRHLAEAGGYVPVFARFDYRVSEVDGQIHQGERYVCTDTPVVAHSAVDDFDIALLRLAKPVGVTPSGPAGGVRGWVDLGNSNADPRPGSPLAIFQHAGGGPLKVALNTDSVVGPHPDGRRLFYRTDTLPGASGGPCFDIDWRLLAMHQGRSIEHGNYNFGLGFAAIHEWLLQVGQWDAVSAKPPSQRTIDISDTGLSEGPTFALDKELRKYLYTVGESERLELKRHAVERMPDGQPKLAGGKPQVAKRLLSSVAAFLNSRSGGTVLVGVSDSREILGVETEYVIVNRQRGNWDAYTLWLGNKLKENLEGTTPMEFISFAPYREMGREICAIHVQPSESPIFVDGSLFVRKQNENIQYRAHELLAYVFSRWSWLGSRTLYTQDNIAMQAD